jgi:hypothetical protein
VFGYDEVTEGIAEVPSASNVIYTVRARITDNIDVFRDSIKVSLNSQDVMNRRDMIDSDVDYFYEYTFSLNEVHAGDMISLFARDVTNLDNTISFALV